MRNVFANPGKDWRNCLLNDYVKFIDYRGRTPKKTEIGLRLITAKNIKSTATKGSLCTLERRRELGENDTMAAVNNESNTF